jgi:hypothetical protein
VDCEVSDMLQDCQTGQLRWQVVSLSGVDGDGSECSGGRGASVASG